MVEAPLPDPDPEVPNVGSSRLLRTRSSSLEQRPVRRRLQTNVAPQRAPRRSLDENQYYRSEEEEGVYGESWRTASNGEEDDDVAFHHVPNLEREEVYARRRRPRPSTFHELEENYPTDHTEDLWREAPRHRRRSNTTRQEVPRFHQRGSFERLNRDTVRAFQASSRRTRQETGTAAADALADLKLHRRQAQRARYVENEEERFTEYPPRRRKRYTYGRSSEEEVLKLRHRPNRLYGSVSEPEDVVEVIRDEEEEDNSASDAESGASFDFTLSNLQDDAATGKANVNGDDDGGISDQPISKEAKEKVDFDLQASQNEHISKTSYNISQSGYVGKSFSESISIALRATQETNTNSQAAPSLFRWIHLTPPVGKPGSMSFRAFMHSALEAPGLNQADKIDLKKTLLWVCEKSEKPLRTLQGQRGCYLDPVFKQVRFTTNKRRHSEKKEIRILCIPYFSLNKYSAQALLSKSTLHPVRTLLQSQYPSVSKERDMQQAVSVAAETPKAYCYHVPQLWSLILNDKLLITYAPVDVAKMCSNKIDISIVPTTNTMVDKHIEVFEPPSRLWLFPLDTCRCWFTFIAHFAEEVNILDNVEDYYKVIHDGRELTPVNWPTVVQLAEVSRVRVQVKRLTPFTQRSRLTGSRAPLVSRTATSLPRGGGDEDESSSSSSSASDDVEPTIKSRDEPSQVHDEEGVQRKGDYSWDRSLAAHSDDETVLPVSAVAVDRIKSLGYELVVQDDNVIFSKNLSVAEIDLILHLSMVFKKSAQEMERHLQSVTKDASQDFHLFLWIGRSNNAGWAAEGLYEALFSTLKYLWKIPNSVERKAFKKCPLSCKTEVEQFVKNQESSRSSSSRSKRLFAAAKALLAFFLPIEIEAAIVRKYWGAVNRIICDEKYTVNVYMLSEFESMAQTITGLRRLLSDGKAPLDLKMPDDFAKAWLHCLMFLILVEPTSTHRATDHLSKAYDLILRGKLEILKKAAESSLRRRQAALPQGLLLEVVSGLLQDMTDGRPDVITTYWDYLRQLELDIKATPLKRAHQRMITSLKQEVDAAIKTLEGQSSVLLDLQSAIVDQAFRKEGKHRDKSRDPEMIISRTCLKTIQAKIAGFEEIMKHANTLRIENLRMIESNKDRQEAAIYAFTIVTVIFLPLSFVSSLLGMNTSDIRDMKQGQWLYWGAALPLTGLIIILCLMFTGDIIDLASWVRKVVPYRSNAYNNNLLPTGSSSDTSTEYLHDSTGSDRLWTNQSPLPASHAQKRGNPRLFF